MGLTAYNPGTGNFAFRGDSALNFPPAGQAGLEYSTTHLCSAHQDAGPDDNYFHRDKYAKDRCHGRASRPAAKPSVASYTEPDAEFSKTIESAKLPCQPAPVTGLRRWGAAERQA